ADHVLRVRRDVCHSLARRMKSVLSVAESLSGWRSELREQGRHSEATLLFTVEKDALGLGRLLTDLHESKDVSGQQLAHRLLRYLDESNSWPRLVAAGFGPPAAVSRGTTATVTVGASHRQDD